MKTLFSSISATFGKKNHKLIFRQPDKPENHETQFDHGEMIDLAENVGDDAFSNIIVTTLLNRKLESQQRDTYDMYINNLKAAHNRKDIKEESRNLKHIIDLATKELNYDLSLEKNTEIKNKHLGSHNVGRNPTSYKAIFNKKNKTWELQYQLDGPKHKGTVTSANKFIYKPVSTLDWAKVPTEVKKAFAKIQTTPQTATLSSKHQNRFNDIKKLKKYLNLLNSKPKTITRRIYRTTTSFPKPTQTYSASTYNPATTYAPHTRRNYTPTIIDNSLAKTFPISAQTTSAPLPVNNEKRNLTETLRSITDKVKVNYGYGGSASTIITAPNGYVLKKQNKDGSFSNAGRNEISITNGKTGQIIPENFLAINVTKNKDTITIKFKDAEKDPLVFKVAKGLSDYSGKSSTTSPVKTTSRPSSINPAATTINRYTANNTSADISPDVSDSSKDDNPFGESKKDTPVVASAIQQGTGSPKKIIAPNLDKITRPQVVIPSAKAVKTAPPPDTKSTNSVETEAVNLEEENQDLTQNRLYFMTQSTKRLAEIQSLQATNRGLEGSIQHLTKENKTLTAENEQLKTENKQLKKENQKTNQETNGELEDKIITLEAANEEQKTEIKKLGDKIKELLNEINKLTEKLATYLSGKTTASVPTETTTPPKDDTMNIQDAAKISSPPKKTDPQPNQSVDNILLENLNSEENIAEANKHAEEENLNVDSDRVKTLYEAGIPFSTLVKISDIQKSEFNNSETTTAILLDKGLAINDASKFQTWLDESVDGQKFKDSDKITNLHEWLFTKKEEATDPTVKVSAEPAQDGADNITVNLENSETNELAELTKQLESLEERLSQLPDSEGKRDIEYDIKLFKMNPTLALTNTNMDNLINQIEVLEAGADNTEKTDTDSTISEVEEEEEEEEESNTTTSPSSESVNAIPTCSTTTECNNEIKKLKKKRRILSVKETQGYNFDNDEYHVLGNKIRILESQKTAIANQEETSKPFTEKKEFKNAMKKFKELAKDLDFYGWGKDEKKSEKAFIKFVEGVCIENEVHPPTKEYLEKEGIIEGDDIKFGIGRTKIEEVDNIMKTMNKIKDWAKSQKEQE